MKPCQHCEFYQGNVCLVRREELPTRCPLFRAGDWVKSPVVRRRVLKQVVHQALRTLYGYLPKVQVSYVEGLSPEAFLSRLPAVEEETTGQRRYRRECHVFVEGLRVLSLDQLPVVVKVVRDGVVLQEGTSVWDALTYLTRADPERLLAVVQVTQMDDRPRTAVLYLFRKEVKRRWVPSKPSY